MTYKIREDKLVVIPNPLKMQIGYNLRGITNRTIEKYEMEVLFKKDAPLTEAMHHFRKQLDSFCEECEGIIELIVKESCKL